MILTYKDLAVRWKVPAATVRKWAQRDRLPPPDVRIGQSPGWYESTISEWEYEPHTPTQM